MPNGDLSQSAELVFVQEKAAQLTTRRTVNGELLSFREPLNKVSVLATCELGGLCYPNTLNLLHTARDYGGVGTNTTTPAFSVNFGKLKQRSSFSNTNTHGFGNILIFEHLLDSGEKWLSFHAHLDSFDTTITGLAVGGLVAKQQQIGIVGCSGTTDTAKPSTQYGWCTGGKATGGNRHDHFEIKKTGLGDNDFWPYGYMNQSEANTKRIAGAPANVSINTVISRLFTTVPTL